MVADDGTVLPADGESVGEFEVRGPWVTGAYYKGEDARPVPRRLAAHRRRRDSRPDGFMHITDRAKDVIKSGGEWISSVELENALMEHPDVVRGGGHRRPGRPLGASGRWPPSWSEPGAERRPAGRCAPSSPSGWRTGSCPSAGRSSTRCPRRRVGKFDKKVLRSRYADGELPVETIGG